MSQLTSLFDNFRNRLLCLAFFFPFPPFSSPVQLRHWNMDHPTSEHTTSDTGPTFGPEITSGLYPDTEPGIGSSSPPVQDTDRSSETDPESLDSQDSLPPIHNANIFRRIRHLPGSIAFLVGTDLSERYAFYSFRVILFLYFLSFGLVSENTARLLFHVFTALNYLSPIPGAWLADDKFGRYPVILTLALVYLVGLGLLTLAAGLSFLGVVFQFILSLAGLGLVAIGAGGIKPTVSSLGADQLRSPLQLLLLPFFFSLWYYMVNVGSFFGILLSPLIRDSIGYTYAFLLAFIILSTAVVVFFVGRKRYHRVPPSSTPLISDLVKVLRSAIRNRFRRAPPPQPFMSPVFSAVQSSAATPVPEERTIGGEIAGHGSQAGLSSQAEPAPQFSLGHAVTEYAGDGGGGYPHPDDSARSVPLGGIKGRTGGSFGGKSDLDVPKSQNSHMHSPIDIETPGDGRAAG